MSQPDGVPDGTLGGYLAKHGRPPAFGGIDGAAYSVEMLLVSREDDDSLPQAFGGALLFVRWSADGAQPVGHLETDYLVHGESRADVKTELAGIPLVDIKDRLDQLVAARREVPDW